MVNRSAALEVTQWSKRGVLLLQSNVPVVLWKSNRPNRIKGKPRLCDVGPFGQPVGKRTSISSASAGDEAGIWGHDLLHTHDMTRGWFAAQVVFCCGESAVVSNKPLQTETCTFYKTLPMRKQGK
jgi:hypothetical protein